MPMAINIRSLLLLPVWCLLGMFLTLSEAFASNVAENCPYGARNGSFQASYSSQSSCEIIFPTTSHVLGSNVAAYYCENGAGYIITKANCGRPDPRPCPDESVCYPPDPDPNCPEGEVCTPSCRTGTNLT